MSFWGRYVPVAERRAKAHRKMEKLRKQGKAIHPVEIEGRTIARSFWGKGWCKHLESFSDFSNRLPRGRRYVCNGSVAHLEVQPGRIDAFVSGSSLYKVSISIQKLKAAKWKRIKKNCAGQVGSMLELLQGKFSEEVMAMVCDQEQGLFPKPKEIELDCDCPDWAVMCKHVAAVLYGVGSRLDKHPELLFLLRGVDAEELIAAKMAIPGASQASGEEALAADDLSAIFGVDIDVDAPSEPVKKPKARPKSVAKKKGKSAPPKAPKKKLQVTPAKNKQETATGGGRSKTVRPTRKNPATTKPRIRPSSRTVLRLRKTLKLSVAEFAETLGVSPATVKRWEAASGALALQARPLAALAALHEQAKEK